MMKCDMYGLFDKEKRDIIEKMNRHMGTKHRSKPYDLNNADDLKQLLLLSVAAYRDYWHYRSTLDNLAGDFDESLEHLDTATWFFMGREPDKADEVAVDCAASLSVASAMFDRIESRAEENLAMIVKVVLSAPPDTQTAVLGRAYNVEPRETDAKIEKLLIMLDEVEYHHPMPDNLRAFLELMEEVWTDC